jgi:methyl-accepting chemotaxis protein
MAWKDVRVQNKFTIGFSFIIIMFVALVISSFLIIQDIISLSEKSIEASQLKLEIIEREVDHLNWDTELAAYLNDPGLFNFTVQTDPQKCLFGQWLNGEKRSHAQSMFPSLAPILKEMEAVHETLHHSALKIKENQTSADTSLGNGLREIKSNLLIWYASLLPYIDREEDAEFPEPLDLKEFPRIGNEFRELSTTTSSLMEILEVIYEEASEIQNFTEEGDEDSALSIYKGSMNGRLYESIASLDRLIEWHDREMDKMDYSRRIYSIEIRSSIQQLKSLFSSMIEIIDENAISTEQIVLEAKSQSITLLIRSLIIILMIILSALILYFSLIRPINKCVGFAESVAAGDLDATLEIDQKDQIGQLADSLRKVLQGFRDKADLVKQFAEGDLTGSVKSLSEKDVLSQSLEKMKKDISHLVSQIAAAVDQISSGAGQIAEASQNLSEGAATQAGSTGEVVRMVSQISEQASQNADMASQAKGISEKASMDAEKGNEKMELVVQFMEVINNGADKTKKVVKVIDDIAFQINLLALNANVEAARAGKYGRGFAVVADEVRNLAVKSAQAARETSQMVEESISNIQNGFDAVQGAADQLQDIVIGSRQVTEILEEIAEASRSQDDDISQATGGLDMIDHITQENTGNAEETASASEELSSQSLQLKGLVDHFTLEKSEKKKRLTASPRPVKRLTLNKREEKEPIPERISTGIKPVNPSDIISLDDNDFDQF